MQKKELKRKQGKAKSTTKKRPSKKNNNLKIAALLAAIAILLICYMILGITFTILIAILIAILAGIWFLLTRKGKKRKIINIILIVCLTLGIIGLVAFSGFVIYIKAKADPKYEKAKLNTLEISRIYASDGSEIAKLGSEKREEVK